MGFYVNPENQTKEAWLILHGQMVTTPTKVPEDTTTKAYVCWVDNGPFTAAGIAFSDREIEVFSAPDDMAPDDMRPKNWFEVPKDDLYSVSNITAEDFG